MADTWEAKSVPAVMRQMLPRTARREWVARLDGSIPILNRQAVLSNIPRLDDGMRCIEKVADYGTRSS